MFKFQRMSVGKSLNRKLESNSTGMQLSEHLSVSGSQLEGRTSAAYYRPDTPPLSSTHSDNQFPGGLVERTGSNLKPLRPLHYCHGIYKESLEYLNGGSRKVKNFTLQVNRQAFFDGSNDGFSRETRNLYIKLSKSAEYWTAAWGTILKHCSQCLT